MTISGNYDIYKSLFSFSTSSISIRNPQTEYLFKGIVASRYTNSINQQLSTEINTFMSAFNNQVSEMANSMDSLFSYEENDEVEENNILENQLYNFKDSFNSFKNLLNDNSENTGIDLVNKQLDNLTDRFNENLNNLGFTKDSQGLLEIDEEKLNEVVENSPEEVKEVFNEKDSFGNKLKNSIKTIKNLPKSTFIQDKIVENSNLNNSIYNYLEDAEKFNLTLSQSQGTLIDMFF